MNYENFKKYIEEQLSNTNDEEKLREAFEIFDTDQTGKVNLKELRHHLKFKGLKLTDDEIDFLFDPEDLWKLEKKNVIEYEKLIDKILVREREESITGQPVQNSHEY